MASSLACLGVLSLPDGARQNRFSAATLSGIARPTLDSCGCQITPASLPTQAQPAAYETSWGLLQPPSAFTFSKTKLQPTSPAVKPAPIRISQSLPPVGLSNEIAPCVAPAFSRPRVPVPASISNIPPSGERISTMALDEYYHNKIEAMKLEILKGQAALRRLEAQRNDYNSRVRLLREELGLLQQPGSYVGEVVK
ncbi:hypothetical protein E4U43_006233, partial [Claviceps pusilla]